MGFDEIGGLPTVSNKQEGMCLCEIDGFKGKTAETFSSVHCCLLLACHSSSTKSRPSTILVVHFASTVGVVKSKGGNASRCPNPNIFGMTSGMTLVKQIQILKFDGLVARGVQQLWLGTGTKPPLAMP